MAKVNFKEAARLAGVSRSTFYVNFINTGKVAYEVEEFGGGKTRKVVDTSEILRVFGRLHGDTSDGRPESLGGHAKNIDKDTPDAAELARLRAENEGLRALLDEVRNGKRQAEQDKAKLFEQLEVVRFLAVPKPEKPGFFARLFGASE